MIQLRTTITVIIPAVVENIVRIIVVRGNILILIKQ